MDELTIDAGDVYVLEIPPRECDCGEVATHYVSLDIRALGQSMTHDETGGLCKSCADDAADRLRAVLPPEQTP